MVFQGSMNGFTPVFTVGAQIEKEAPTLHEKVRVVGSYLGLQAMPSDQSKPGGNVPLRRGSGRPVPA